MPTPYMPEMARPEIKITPIPVRRGILIAAACCLCFFFLSILFYNVLVVRPQMKRSSVEIKALNSKLLKDDTALMILATNIDASNKRITEVADQTDDNSAAVNNATSAVDSLNDTVSYNANVANDNSGAR